MATVPLQTPFAPRRKAWLARVEARLEAERDAIGIWLPVALGAGIMLWFALPHPLAWGGAAALLVGTGLAAHLLGAGTRLGTMLAWGALAAALGLGLVWAQATWVAGPVVARPVTTSFSGIIRHIEPLPARETVRIVVEPIGRADLPHRVRVSIAIRDLPEAPMVAGRGIGLRARLMPPPGPALPGGYDFAQRAWFEGLGAVGSVIGTPTLHGNAASSRSGLRRELTQHIQNQIPGSAGGVAAALAAAPCSWEAAAATITTTDTFPKGAAASAMLGETRVQVAGIVKGSGMIAPDMATMLGYIFTDAGVAPALLQDMLTQATGGTFNSITVDSDTSTSDTVLLFATGAAGNPVLTNWDSPGADALYAAIHAVALELAQLVVRDGEGASKFITVSVTGAVSDASAKRVALSIANSPLVKTAIAGEDANWGRVVMAVGKAGEPADRDRLGIRFGDTQVARDGLPVEGYDEAPVTAHLKGSDIRIAVDLGLGEGRATVWTCDFSYDYVRINAEYRT